MLAIATQGRGALSDVLFENRDIRAMVESFDLKQVGRTPKNDLTLPLTNQTEQELSLRCQVQFAEQFKLVRAERVLCEATTRVLCFQAK